MVRIQLLLLFALFILLFFLRCYAIFLIIFLVKAVCLPATKTLPSLYLAFFVKNIALWGDDVDFTISPSLGEAFVAKKWLLNYWKTVRMHTSLLLVLERTIKLGFIKPHRSRCFLYFKDDLLLGPLAPKHRYRISAELYECNCSLLKIIWLVYNKLIGFIAVFFSCHTFFFFCDDFINQKTTVNASR